MRDALADSPVVAVKSLRIAVGAEPRCGVVLVSECDQPKKGRNRMSEPRSKVKSHDIPKLLVNAANLGGGYQHRARWTHMPYPLILGAFDLIRVIPDPLDHTRIGPRPPQRVEPLTDLGHHLMVQP